MKKIIIFDLDGTLLDTLEDLKNSVNHALLQVNSPLKSKEEVRKAIGNGVSKLVERCLAPELRESHYIEALTIFKNHYDIHYADNTIPYKDVNNLLKQLKKDGYLLAVCTNKIQNVAEILVNNFFPNIFDVIVGDQESLNKKPAPDMVNYVLNKTKIERKDALYIGDTEVDRETAINSGIDFIIETYGYRTKEEWLVLDIKQKTFATPNDIYQEIKSWN